VNFFVDKICFSWKILKIWQKIFSSRNLNLTDQLVQSEQVFQIEDCCDNKKPRMTETGKTAN